jgi:hypothetical protein
MEFGALKVASVRVEVSRAAYVCLSKMLRQLRRCGDGEEETGNEREEKREERDGAREKR